MARSGLDLDPRSRPGTILPGYGTNPLEVAQGRMKQEQVAGLQADKIAADKEKADKAAQMASVPEFGTAYAPHTNEFLKKTGAFTNNFGSRLQKYNQTKDPNDDPTNPSSRAFMETQAEKWALNQELKISQQDQADWTAFEKEYNANPGKYTPEEFQMKRAYHEASPALKISGQVTAPEIVGYWDKGKVIKEAFDTIPETAWENSVYDPTLDMFTETGGAGISDKTIKGQAFAIAAPGTQSGMRWEKEVSQLPVAAQQKLATAAQKEGVTPAQYKAYEDMKGLAYNKYTESKKNAGLQQSKFGAGWGSDMASMERLADEIINSGDLTSPHWRRFSGWYSGDAPQGYKGTPIGVNMGFNGLKVGKDDDGKDVFVTSTVDNGDGTISLIAQNDVTSKTAGVELMRMPAKDFANNIVNTIAENNTDIDREVLERVLKEKGAVTGEGFVKTKQASKTAQQMAEERRKASGSGKNTKAMD